MIQILESYLEDKITFSEAMVQLNKMDQDKDTWTKVLTLISLLQLSIEEKCADIVTLEAKMQDIARIAIFAIK